MDQVSVFDFMYNKYKITKPIRLIEFFAGYGSQALALKYLGVPFEHWKICEWAVKSIQAYRDIHFPNSYCPSGLLDIPKEHIIKCLYEWGISSNYNEPMTLEQIKRLKNDDLYNIYENIIVTNNLVNIQQVKAEDLEIVDTDKFDYILTYSFPCQDLSLAGKRKGMSDTSTRSGMLWEVERILNECKELNTLPQILLMENVPQVHSKENIEDFRKWQLALEKLGYQSYWQDLIATDYGIPQTRNRCFMISILGKYNYSFPKPIPLKLKLKDLLEDDVDKKYYLSDKAINGLTIQMQKDHKPNLIDVNNEPNKPFSTITCCYRKQGHYETYLKIKNATKKGYLEASYGDGIDISSRMEHHRGTAQKNKIQTITTAGGNDRGVVTTENYFPSNHNAVSDLRIRKLTPRECFRLMGVKDEDYDKVSKNQSDASLYHLAGDSIVVNVLEKIFNNLLEE